MGYNIKIDAFEGPMDLLLHLINRSNRHLRYSDGRYYRSIPKLHPYDAAS